MPGWAPYLLLLLFFVGVLPLVVFGARARDVAAEEAALAQRTTVRVRALGQITKIAAAAMAALGAVVGAVAVLLRLRRRNSKQP